MDEHNSKAQFEDVVDGSFHQFTGKIGFQNGSIDTSIKKKNGFTTNSAHSLSENKMADHVTIERCQEQGTQTLLQRKTELIVSQKKMAPESLRREAKDLAYDIVYYVSNVKKLNPSSKYATTMRRVVDELSQRHEILFKSMINKLNVAHNGDGFRTMKEVLDEMFSDRQYNWGRIVTAYAFGGVVSKFCVDKNMFHCVDSIAELLGDYVANNLAWWIHQQGGWAAFVEYFPEQKSFEEKIWKGLLFTAVGLGALATMVAAR